MKSIALAAIAGAILAGCGGGGGNPGVCMGSPAVCNPPASSSPAAVVVANAASVAGQCAAPRPSNAIDPVTQRPYGDVQGSLETEKAWIRAFVNETYLWYDEVPAVNPASYVVGATVPFIDPASNRSSLVRLDTNLDVVGAYFNSQRSLQLAPSGIPKDRFHFIVPTEEWNAQSSSGSRVGFGFNVKLIATTPPRKALVAYSDPGSIAANNGVVRGTEFVSINGVDVANGDPNILNEALFSPVSGKPYTFRVRDQGSSIVRTVIMTPGMVASVPVQNVRTLAAPNNGVGYLQFNDHIATAESQLIAAVNDLKASNNGAGISDLVLDLRYNGGGFLDLASELAYMIAGPAATNGKIFEKLSFNDKNPFGRSEADQITPFYSVSQGFSTAPGQALPTLNLRRVYVITGVDTCSASEAVINGLRGVGVEVIQIGGTSCGKPYGFLPQDNCSTTYFAVQFKGVNHLGFGDYPDGFIPGGTGPQAYNLPGCIVADDFSKPLGDISEGRIAAALRFRNTGSCSVLSSSNGPSILSSQQPLQEPVLGWRSAAQQNRIYRPSPGL